MAEVTVRCHGCGKDHTFDERVPFRAECEACVADLHACLACRFYDRYVENECREPSAEPVRNKDRSNLCEWFKPSQATPVEDDEVAKAKAKLEALFKKK